MAVSKHADAAFAGRSAIVTGAGNGIGKAITQALVERGARVVAVDLNEADLTASFAEHDAVHRLVMDVTAEDAPATIVAAALKQFGGLDFLINNAGIAIAGDFETLSDEQWDTIMDVNVHDGVPLFVAERLEVTGNGNAGVVDQKIEAAELFERRRNNRRWRILSRHIHHQAVNCVMLSERRSQIRLVQIDRDNACAALDQRLGNGLTDAVAGTGNNG